MVAVRGMAFRSWLVALNSERNILPVVGHLKMSAPNFGPVECKKRNKAKINAIFSDKLTLLQRLVDKRMQSIATMETALHESDAHLKGGQPVERRSRQDRRSSVDRRSEKQIRSQGERRSNSSDRRSGNDRRSELRIEFEAD